MATVSKNWAMVAPHSPKIETRNSRILAPPARCGRVPQRMWRIGDSVARFGIAGPPTFPAKRAGMQENPADCAGCLPRRDATDSAAHVEFRRFPQHPRTKSVNIDSPVPIPRSAKAGGQSAGMSDHATPTVRADPLVDRSGRISGTGRLIVLAFGLVGVAIGFAFLSSRTQAQPFVLGLLGILAVIGVVDAARQRHRPRALRRTRPGRRPRPRVRRCDWRGRAGHRPRRAHRLRQSRLCRSDRRGRRRATCARSSASSSGNADATEAIYRIAQELREGRTATEEVRVPAPLDGSDGSGARWYRISARPLPLGAAQDAADRVDASPTSRSERARQEAVFQELQHAIDYLDHAPAGFFSAEPDGRIVYLNATLAEWLGIDLAAFRAGRADARRHRPRRRHRAAVVAARRRDAQPHRHHRPRSRQAERPEPAGAAAAPRAGDRRRRARRDAHDGAQPHARRGGVGGAARGRGALHPLLQQHADRHRRHRQAGPHRPHQRAVPAHVRRRRASTAVEAAGRSGHRRRHGRSSKRR